VSVVKSIASYAPLFDRILPAEGDDGKSSGWEAPSCRVTKSPHGIAIICPPRRRALHRRGPQSIIATKLFARRGTLAVESAKETQAQKGCP